MKRTGEMKKTPVYKTGLQNARQVTGEDVARKENRNAMQWVTTGANDERCRVAPQRLPFVWFV